MEWLPIESAPKDGTWILAFGSAYTDMTKGRPLIHDVDNPGQPFTMVIRWAEYWYDKEIDLGGGTYRRQRALGHACWAPEPGVFRPTHWMPLPDPPADWAPEGYVQVKDGGVAG